VSRFALCGRALSRWMYQSLSDFLLECKILPSNKLDMTVLQKNAELYVSKPAEPSHPKKVKCTSYLMSKLEQHAVARVSTLKGLRHRRIQIEFSDVYHEQAFQLPARRNSTYALPTRQGTWKMNRGLNGPRRPTSWAQLQSCFVTSHLHHARRYADN
jgi:hypothetical protein